MTDRLTTAQAAERLGVSSSQIYWLVNQGKLTPWERHGNAYVFTAADLDEYEKTRRPRGRPRKPPLANVSDEDLAAELARRKS